MGFKLNLSQVAGNRKGGAIDSFIWRDKGLEVVIRTLHNHLNKQTFEDFFKAFDSDHDNHLSPSEFRQALLSIKGS